jgi:hypothetical protein
MIASPLPMSNIVGEQNDFSGQFAASRAQSVEHGVTTIGVSKKDNSRLYYCVTVSDDLSLYHIAKQYNFLNFPV